MLYVAKLFSSNLVSKSLSRITLLLLVLLISHQSLKYRCSDHGTFEYAPWHPATEVQTEEKTAFFLEATLWKTQMLRGEATNLNKVFLQLPTNAKNMHGIINSMLKS